MLLNPSQGELYIDDRATMPTSIAFSLIVPTYNEAKNIPELVHRITTLLDPLYPNEYELIIVDDNSPDGTADRARELAQKYPIQVLQRAGKLGLSSAVIDGWNLAKGEVLSVTDADLSHDPSAFYPSPFSDAAILTIDGVGEWATATICE